MEQPTSFSTRSVPQAARLLRNSGVPSVLKALWGKNRVTVLAYHRIADVAAPDFFHLEDNVSATPAGFAQQMEYVRRHFQVIDLATLVEAIDNGGGLPERALLITFDDGYYDNFLYAYPVLKRLGLPAVFFLTTGEMGVSRVPWWDRVACCFHRTQRPRADLPLIGEQALDTPGARTAARNRLLARMKQVPDDEKWQALDALSHATQVAPPSHEPGLFMQWDHAREVEAHGIACQPHTVDHPILTRVDGARMRRELAGSFKAIEEQLGRSAVAFAYPNGTQADYDQSTIGALRDLGCRVAFTMRGRLSTPEEILGRPYEIPRLYIGYRDTLDMFALKVHGLFVAMQTVAGPGTVSLPQG